MRKYIGRHISLLCLSSMVCGNAFAAISTSNKPTDWPALKPGMTTSETIANGKPSPKVNHCVTQAEIEESIRISDELERNRKECGQAVYSKRGNVFTYERSCRPSNKAAYIEKVESTQVSSNQVSTKTWLMEAGKTTTTLDITTTRTGECTGKEKPQPNSLEAILEQVQKDAEQGARKKSK